MEGESEGSVVGRDERGRVVEGRGGEGKEAERAKREVMREKRDEKGGGD